MSLTNGVIKLSPAIRLGIEKVKRDVLGHAAQLNIKTGYKNCRRQLKGVYLNQYHMDTIDFAARKVMPGYLTELQERRKEKAELLKRRARGKAEKEKAKLKKK